MLQRGLIGALRLEPYSARIVQPHEDVAPGPVIGRRQLMEATQANLEPIFLLYQGGNGAATELVDSIASGREPLAEASTPDGLRHRLWAITDPDELSAIAADLAPRTALIADGHHRYAAYLQLQDRVRQAGAGAGPWDCGLALLVDSTAYPPQLGAIHRVVTGMVPEAAARLASSAFTVRELPGGTADVPAALAALEEACKRDPVAFLLAGQRARVPADRPRPAAGAASRCRTTRRSCGSSCRRRCWKACCSPGSGRSRTTRAACGPSTTQPRRSRPPMPSRPGTAVICGAMSATQVYEVAALGRRVPRKSTSFGPKPRTGLVMRLFAES